jgi:uncharacterized protein
MDTSTMGLLAAGILVIAALYSSIGHAGASGYIALMTLIGLAPAEIRPVALTLNLLVATVGSIQFARAGHFSWRHFWPFALLAIPAAYLGGKMSLPVHHIRTILGIVLLFSAGRLLIPRSPQAQDTVYRLPPLAASLALGALIGYLSGLTGTGGGIFLTPLLLFSHWAPAKTAAAVSALFIWVNSAAGLLGFISQGGQIPSYTWPLTLAALIGGSLGAYSGSRFFSPLTIQRVLALVLLIASYKLFTS